MQVNTEHMDMRDDLLISYLLGEASAEEIKQVEEWRKTDEACNKRLEEFSALWAASKNLTDNEETDARDSLARFKEKADERKRIRANTGRLKQRNTWLGIAASLLLLAGCSWLYFSQFSVTKIQLITNAKTQTTTLPDGSVITLNRLSRFEYPSRFKTDQRQVKLTEGEAFFNVAHNKAKPFVISAGSALIKVVGTSFNVKNKKGNVEVIVETGIVQVSRNGLSVILKPGEKVLVKQSSSILEKESNTDKLYTYYRSKEFVAEDTPLWRVVEVLNEAYDTHIIIGRKELKNLPLNTTFKNESLDKILDVIARTFKITVEKKHENIILK